jgi:hypothetical protein
LAVDEGQLSVLCTGHFTPGKEQQVFIEWEADKTRSWSGHCGEGKYNQYDYCILTKCDEVLKELERSKLNMAVLMKTNKEKRYRE